MVTPKDVYFYFNVNYFGGRLPKIPIIWDNRYFETNDALGCTWFDVETHRPKKISLNPKYKKFSRVWGLTLVHEMVHVQQWRDWKKNPHGRAFNKRMKQLAARGALNMFW